MKTDGKERKLKYLDWAHQRSGQKRAHIALLLALVFAISLIFLTSLRFFSYFVGFVPVFRTFEYVRSKYRDDDVSVFFLTYWAVVGSFISLESLLEEDLFWLPSYYILKSCLFIWAFHSETKGATLLYQKFVVLLMDYFSKNTSTASSSVSLSITTQRNDN